MSFAEDYTISPKNSLVSTESISARQYYSDPPSSACSSQPASACGGASLRRSR